MFECIQYEALPQVVKMVFFFEYKMYETDWNGPSKPDTSKAASDASKSSFIGEQDNA